MAAILSRLQCVKLYSFIVYQPCLLRGKAICMTDGGPFTLVNSSDDVYLKLFADVGKWIYPQTASSKPRIFGGQTNKG